MKDLDLQCKTNNFMHHTNEISLTELLVRRGQAFTLTLTLSQPFKPQLYPLSLVAATGLHYSEEHGTVSYFGIPDTKTRSPSAKAVWKIELLEKSFPEKGVLVLSLLPPANAPIGEYIVTARYRDEDMLLATLVVLFNPWCADDQVYLSDEKERKEYVMNEQGIIYNGSANYISSRSWDFGQFEDDMVRIGMMILDLNHKHQEDPAEDVCGRSDPVYVGRVVSAMINSEDDHGVLEGQWGGPYSDGIKPSHWTGSHAILKHWYDSQFKQVKYGQCWVFAGVMCSVMRLLGIPCRVVTNFSSAHDTNSNLTIDMYHSDHGVAEKSSPDSVWNFHVWVEAWMKRPDLGKDDAYDGWQVLDPTPQELSSGVYCCGPAPVKAIKTGNVDLKYDIPFVFAEVNADCVDWLVKADGSKVKLLSDTKRVGQNISTKSVGSNKRRNITINYKHMEGSEKERQVFKYALTRDFTIEEDYEEEEEEEEEELDNEETTENEAEVSSEVIVPLPEVSLRFEVLTKPMNGKDVKMNLMLHSQSTFSRPLTINISVQAMGYNGSPAGNILNEVKDETLQPEKDLSIPILVPFLAYHKLMVECDSMKVSAIVTDKEQPDHIYLAENDVVLQDPPMSLTASVSSRLHKESSGEIVFKNPANETLTKCKLTLSGSGIFREEAECILPDLRPKNQFRVKFYFYPYKTGEKTIMADIDCATFRDIQAVCKITVTE